MPCGRSSGTLPSTWSLLWVSFLLSFALPGRVEAENWSPWGLKGVSEGHRKTHKIDSKSLPVAIGGLKRAGGYPPGACGAPRVHIYAYLCMYLCIFMHIYAYLRIFMQVFIRIHAYSYIFMHIYAYLCRYLCVLMHIHAYLCIFYACFMHMYAYSCIFMHIYVYSCICLMQGKYIYS